MPTLSPAGPQPQAATPRGALPFRPDCRPAPRPGAPVSRPRPGPPTVAALPQRALRERALALTAAGFPGLALDLEHERGAINTQVAEGELGRVGLAYLRAERSAGAPPIEQVAAVTDMVRLLDQTRARLARAEITGPVSLAMQIVDEQERPLAYTPPLREALSQHVTLRAAWLRDQISAHLGAALICLDEPFLDALSSPFCPLDWGDGIDLLARVLDEAPRPRCLCIAGAPSWAAVLALPVDMVFFDAYEHGADLIQAANAVAGYLDRGGTLGWGVVPNDPAALTQERAETLASRFESTVEYLAAAGGLDAARIRAAALISTSGGLAHLTPDLATHAADLCWEVSAHIWSKYGLEPGTAMGRPGQ